jgi:hypothetical protein
MVYDAKHLLSPPSLRSYRWQGTTPLLRLWSGSGVRLRLFTERRVNTKLHLWLAPKKGVFCANWD